MNSCVVHDALPVESSINHATGKADENSIFNGDIALNKACEKTIIQHPGLVPDEWNDTDATLKKTVTRLDKIPSISQKNGYIEFKKLKKDKKQPLFVPKFAIYARIICSTFTKFVEDY